MQKIGEIAARAGCSVEAVRFYEQQGLLPAAHRTEAGHRLFDESIIDRLLIIRGARQLDFPLEKIRQVLDAMEGQATCREVQQIAAGQLASIERKIGELRHYRDELQGMLGRCGGEADEPCVILESWTSAE